MQHNVIRVHAVFSSWNHKGHNLIKDWLQDNLQVLLKLW